MVQLMDECLYRMLRRERSITLKVTGAYRSSVCGYAGECFITLLSSQKDLLPYSVRMAPSFSFSEIMHDQEIRLTFDSEPGGVMVEEPAPRSLKLRKVERLYEKERTAVLRGFLEGAVEKGYELLPIPDEILSVSRDTEGRPSSVMDEVIGDRIGLLIAALIHKRTIEIPNMLGYGKGLTPSTDDFMLGLYSVMEAAGDVERMELLKQYMKRHMKTTTEVSYWMLHYALYESGYPEIILEYFREEGSRPQILEKFFKHGSSSGVDMLTGILCGLHIVQGDVK